MGVLENSFCQQRWRRLAVQLASWYYTPSGAVGHRFTKILAVELQGVLNRRWNSVRPIFFVYINLKKTLVFHRAREIRAIVKMRLNLWKKGIHEVLVG